MFLGGGTPTVLAAADVTAILRAVDERIGIAAGAEVTIEANPEDLDDATLAALREAGVTAISLGMQSVQPHVLRALDRAHTPGRAREAVVASARRRLRRRRPRPDFRLSRGDRR